MNSVEICLDYKFPRGALDPNEHFASKIIKKGIITSFIIGKISTETKINITITGIAMLFSSMYKYSWTREVVVWEVWRNSDVEISLNIVTIKLISSRKKK